MRYDWQVKNNWFAKKMHQQDWDQVSLELCRVTLELASVPEIRDRSFANLAKWKKCGTWGLVYDEWHSILTRASDDEIVKIMTSLDDNSCRLRASPPFIGFVGEVLRETIVGAAMAKYDKQKRRRKSTLMSNRDVLALAADVFGDDDAADLWLSTPSAIFAGASPADYLVTHPEGAAAVCQVLNAIGTGGFV